jgi:hypothetical protein
VAKFVNNFGEAGPSIQPHFNKTSMKYIRVQLLWVAFFSFCIVSSLHAQSHGVAAGEVILHDTSGHTTTIQPSSSGSGTFTPPINSANSGDVITSDGSGGTSWQPPTSGFTPQMIDVYTTGVQFLLPATSCFFTNIAYASGLFSLGTDVIVTVAGVYRIDFSVYPTFAAQFGIEQNGIPVPSGAFLCAANALTSGSALVLCLAGDVLDISNQGAGLVILNAGGAVDASLIVTRVQ